MKHFDRGVAERALAHWRGEPESLAHVATSGNAVYRFREDGLDRILRLTDHAWRSPEQNDAELAFLEHLVARGAQVAAPVRSRSGARLERLPECSACVFVWAPGAIVAPDGPHWNAPMFRAWGRALAQLHEASRRYTGPLRWEWWQEGLIADADTLLPADDRTSREEFDRVMSRVHALPMTDDTYGMTHADFGAQNFHYEPVRGVTSFDFGNCCRSWFLSDLMISLSTLRRRPDRDRLRTWVLEGYRERFPIDAGLWEQRSWLLRLRVLYVYLSRLRWFGPDPTTEQRAILHQLRGVVAEHLEW